MTTSPEHAPVPPVAHLDAEAERFRREVGQYTDLPRGQVAMRQLLDAVDARIADPIGREALETARTVIGVLDAVKIHRPPPREVPPPKRSFLGNVFGAFEEQAPPPEPEAQVLVNVDRLLDSVRDVLDGAQRLQKQAEPPPPEVVTRPWHEDAELMKLLQDLLAAVRRKTPEYLVGRVEQIAEDLSGHPHEIDVVEFDGTNRTHFTIDPSTRPEDTGPRTVRPALVHDDRLVRPGEAREPVSTSIERTAL